MKLLEIAGRRGSSVGDYLAASSGSYDEEKKALWIGHCNLSSWEGSPEKIRDLHADHNLFHTLEGMPTILDGGFVDLAGCKNLTSFHNVHKHLKVGKGSAFQFDHEMIKEGGLGLLLVDNLHNLYSSSEIGDQQIGQHNHPSWYKIVKRYIPCKEKSWLYECQEALIHAGYTEHIKL